jgi:predicted phosphoribosyltransferase
MFKNRLDAAKQLAEKLNQDQIKPTKIIGLTKGGQKLAKYLKKLLPPTSSHKQLVTIIADDGGISLAKLIHAVKLYRRKNVQKIIVALPVYKHENIKKIEKLADAVYTVQEPSPFISAEEFYQDF